MDERPHIPKTNRAVWLMAFGYFVAYAPYAALVKAMSAGIVPGVPRGISGLELLPSAIAGTVITLPLLVTIFGWWRYAGRLRLEIIISGIGTAIIIGTTTLAYTFSGISIVFALLLLRGGVLILAPVVDLALRRRVRWFSWAALAVCATAVALTMLRATDRRLTLAAIANTIAYLVGYSLRLPCMTKAGKLANEESTRRYFVEEMSVAMVVLAGVPLLLAAAGVGELRHGVALAFTGTMPAGFLIGALYSLLYVFGTLIYLDRRENTFCVPLNRSSSLLSGLVASYALVYVGLKPPSAADVGGAALVLFAMLLLTPFHHVLEWIVEPLAKRFSPSSLLPPLPPSPVRSERAVTPPRPPPEEPRP